MGIIKSSFLDTIKVIKKKKIVFAFLILLQILLLVSISSVGIKYQIEISESAMNVIEPLQNANYNSTSIEEGNPFMSNMMSEVASITKSYQEMIKSIFEMIGLMFCFFLVFNGLIWSISNKLIKKGKLLDYWLKFIIVTLVFMIPFSLISYYLLRGFLAIGTEVANVGVNTIGWIFMIVSYFMVIGFCLTEEKVKILFKKIFSIGIMKIYWVLLAFMFSLGTTLLSLMFIYYSIGNLLLMIVSGFVLVVILVLGKLFLINVIRKLN